ncbi:PepSY domain-containing protein [Aerococcaceae bacterium zg-B36]|uniref:PepSY domain-containing protein n=1 Tax=Aerococcaceae bacterium zg-252 TaxID=2796928 RepID=UPI001BD8699A|nr:PepSY domain-containing protein [Aerococcaceae bacterium zg-B36]
MKKLVLTALISGTFLIPVPNGMAQETTTQAVASSNATLKTDVLKGLMTFEEVVAAYQKEFPNTDIQSIELERQLDKWVVSVEGLDNDNEYDIKFNATTKEVISKGSSVLDTDEANGIEREKEKIELNKLSSFDDAAQVALAEVTSGEVMKWDLERDNGVTYWEVTIKDGQQVYEVRLDAYSKKVLEVEIDD